MTREEWVRQGTELFGESMMDWEFVCPSCQHVQKVSDFKQYAEKGATTDAATNVCIGRYDGNLYTPMCFGKSPCNYAAFGLLDITPITVVDEDKKHIPVFGFNKK